MPVIVRGSVVLPTTDLLTVEDMRQVGEMARLAIVTRTRSGRDVDGLPFAPYSARYAKQRTAAGLSTRPDLTVSGGMLNDLRVISATHRTVTLGYGDGA